MYFFLQTPKRKPSNALQRWGKSEEDEDMELSVAFTTHNALKDEKHVETKLQEAVKNLDRRSFISLAKVRSCQFLTLKMC